MNILLSYPRSGNHLVRFFIELLSEMPTFGCNENPKDIEIYKNNFSENINFNIKKEYKISDCFRKFHQPPKNKYISLNKNCELILILRNPKEVLLRHNNFRLNFKGGWDSYEEYFKGIDFFKNFKGKKLLLYYEDIVTNKVEFINKLYDFLQLDNIEKKNYVLSNIDKLYELSKNGENRDWGKVKSNSINYYYKNIPAAIKNSFDDYLKIQLKKHPFLVKKYYENINISDINNEDRKEIDNVDNKVIQSSDNIINYIFYHDKNELNKYFNISNSLFKPIDLNKLPLHTDLLVDFKKKEENEKITILNLSEINGILNIKNDSQSNTDFIGIFTYSIPKKFSLEWSIKKNNKFFYVNKFTFNDINNRNIKYDKNYVYCIEIRDIENNYKEIFNKLHNSNLGINNNKKLEFNKIRGPFKSSFIIEKNRFFLFQEWLKSATNWYINEYKIKNKNSYPNNRYDIGNVLERLECYYIYQKYHNKLILLQKCIKSI